MTGLPTLLLKELKKTLRKCGPFGSDQALQAVFVDNRIALWKDYLPGGIISTRERIDQLVSVFLDLSNDRGENGLALFLHVLCDEAKPGDGCCQRLKDMAAQVEAALGCGPVIRQPSSATSPPLALNHLFICYAPRDGADHAQRLHAALTDAGLRPWLDVLDTPAGYAPEAAREEALRDCAAVLLVLTPSAADVQSDCAGEWRRALRY